MYRHLRFRCDYDRVERAARLVNDKLQDAGFPPVLVEAHRLSVPEFPEVIALLATYLPVLSSRLLDPCR